MQKKDRSTVLWWIGWIALTIVSFFVSCAFWTPVIARRIGGMDTPNAPILWVAAVFGSWMVLLVPLIIVMYAKVDKAYEDARIARESTAFQKARSEFNIRSILVDESARTLEARLTAKLKKVPTAIRRGHLVTALLKDGRRVENVFVLDRKEVLGIYGAEVLDFKISDITNIEPANLDALPAFQAEKWLRLDGVGGAIPTP